MQFLCVILFVLLVVLQTADGFLTWRILRAGRELNPLLRALMGGIGTMPALVVSKVLLLVLAWLYLLDLPLVLLTVAVLYMWVVWHNWTQLRKGAQK